ncbi:hypothetical protein [Streptomyces sp. CC208A]|uniref:hypothetical protein n=1 Tax=Streptomyces sp. CC208A TaxID=3044573 RepID=UPI0024A7E396|nr:hypothetical protein [Streptomyces sp. CC208A]
MPGGTAVRRFTGRTRAYDQSPSRTRAYGQGVLRRFLARARVHPVAYALVLACTAGLLVLAGPGTGSADAVSVCQGRPARTVSFATGELRVYRTRQYACALVLAKRPGAPRPMKVTLQPRGGRAAVVGGTWGRQAGPVTVHALNRCVRATATVSGRSAATGWILC